MVDMTMVVINILAGFALGVFVTLVLVQIKIDRIERANKQLSKANNTYAKMIAKFGLGEEFIKQ